MGIEQEVREQIKINYEVGFFDGLKTAVQIIEILKQEWINANIHPKESNEYSNFQCKIAEIQSVQSYLQGKISYRPFIEKFMSGAA